ncbi:3-keto-5-aminohexanoate cleavage protein [Alicyclobacillus cycloheptanicus]|uniref:3-keto-5-aminohexanoate cleavage enzyme n=1 Tax=Alicyclobacillus cycloheptanicus TaxID=1457 RepID=A0ABT9XHE3_9BACL|nr:3-keto-5-aminohexanoate cleavage protein [Alicyclobacillus cycloheptanicus]MDQ0189454.1 3-keto-5-aminohexanoate cleavage enzyme [Alicyclobacillus cycloheptanicus]WDM02322.1 3-keto-5-aminohexanoate cleavage protein [Alicyclobacillus cycloheptanicus]
MDKLIITAAMVGAEVTREAQPNLPITPDEIAQAARECREAGASICHLHVRNDDGTPTQSRDRFQETIARIREATDIIIQVSTGGAVGMTPEERLQPVSLRPEMATLTCGTVNFGEDVFWNGPRELKAFAKALKVHGVRPEFEIFDAGMIANALQLADMELVEPPFHFDFVLGVPGGLPATPKNVLYLTELLPPGATWSVAGVGRHQLPMAALAVTLGGHVRVGFEDNIFYRKGELAVSNAQLVERVVRIARELDRPIATPDEARRMLGIPRASGRSTGEAAQDPA